MKNSLVFLLIIVLISCRDNNLGQELKIESGKEIDVEAELASIEQTRSGFEKAVKEKRYSDLQQFATSDLISLTPICGDWEEYKNLSENSEAIFSYDSLKMKPKETVIVSDSIAYDLGTSSVYYTNSEGEVVEITDTFLAILKKDKQDGTWKLFREVATTNMLE